MEMGRYLKTERTSILKRVKDIRRKGGWTSGVKPLYFSIRQVTNLAASAESEIRWILRETTTKVTANHALRLHRLGEAGDKLNRDICLVLNQETQLDDKDPLFTAIRKAYDDTRQLAIDMSLLCDWSLRLKDFEGSPLAGSAPASGFVTFLHSLVSSLLTVAITILGSLIASFLAWKAGWL